ncbi:zincin-like metallopeptidase domain-containing protein [Eubacterium aggregans]|uniref:zincin-like metallopeptidase domain-containing protein n=1 Tax=Eubacterium aggregans TaxID=81409 RepID=UPI003F3EA73F
MKNKNLNETIRDEIVNRLETAMVNKDPFHLVKPWNGGAPFPCSYETSKPYQGINQLLLEPGEYITFNSVKHLQNKISDLSVYKGAHAKPLYYCNRAAVKDKDENPVIDEQTGKEKERFFTKYWNVFALEYVKNLPSKFPYKKHEHTLTESMDKADRFISNYCNKQELDLRIVKGSGRAYFRPLENTLNIPNKEQFESIYEYYSTCFHELAHSTMIPLGRDKKSHSSIVGQSEDYAQEELVAEISAAMLCNGFQIVDDERTFENSFEYLKGWDKHIKSESSGFVSIAASQAQKAVDFFVQAAGEDEYYLQPVEPVIKNKPKAYQENDIDKILCSDYSSKEQILSAFGNENMTSKERSAFIRSIYSGRELAGIIDKLAFTAVGAEKGLQL